jgi:autotransporter adhesin
VTAAGYCGHAEGHGTVAYGAVSHAEGIGTEAFGNYSHAEGNNTTASGASSHAEGNTTTASGGSSHAEGYNTTASGRNSHTEGISTTASGDHSHAEGYNTTASGYSSHANGYYTRAGYNCQTVVGMCNDNKSNTLFEVGNGTSEDDRRNAFEVLKDGRVKVYGTPTEDEDVVRKKDLATLSSSYTAGRGISISDDGTISVTFADYTGAFTGDGEII